MIPVAGGISDTPLSSTGMLMNLFQLFGHRFCISQKGIGRIAPMTIAYNWTWYIELAPNCRVGPIRPLRAQRESANTRRDVVSDHLNMEGVCVWKGGTTYQTAEAVKNTGFRGQLSLSLCVAEHISGILLNIHSFTATWTILTIKPPIN